VRKWIFRPAVKIGREDDMNRFPLAVILICATCTAAADDLNFSPATGKRLKTETSTPGVSSVNRATSTATCRKGVAVAGYCGSQSGPRQLQNVGVVATTQWACTWTEPTEKAQVTALCLFEE
jgi:hypothetical protein